jgi:cation transporter-like permease
MLFDALDPDDLEVPLAVAITDTVGEVSLAKLTATALPVASLTGA